MPFIYNADDEYHKKNELILTYPHDFHEFVGTQNKYLMYEVHRSFRSADDKVSNVFKCMVDAKKLTLSHFKKLLLATSAFIKHCNENDIDDEQRKEFVEENSKNKHFKYIARLASTNKPLFDAIFERKLYIYVYIKIIYDI